MRLHRAWCENPRSGPKLTEMTSRHPPSYHRPTASAQVPPAPAPAGPAPRPGVAPRGTPRPAPEAPVPAPPAGPAWRPSRPPLAGTRRPHMNLPPSCTRVISTSR
ncbi:hypothetical protein SCOCK_600023 [Actinacidiphila cocklensis]|uniref:Uncharacterized protein n=1 Tax=Actinacidiphila cocklensis TaxID=887465 RepID=A0A9W4GWQ4_9ACTN|nr:hypothetical protein SCOCK_600023 [Actinacidiphila cocklensis]